MNKYDFMTQNEVFSLFLIRATSVPTPLLAAVAYFQKHGGTPAAEKVVNAARKWLVFNDSQVVQA